MSDPVSWKVARRGWKVVHTSGDEVGHVKEILGDAEADIFDGLLVSRGLLSRPKYVPSEDVAEIREGEVVLSLPPDAVDRLGERAR